jgi:DMSO/TMAO reductase YedYZ molybdopterin-dependent catalytic subunit
MGTGSSLSEAERDLGLTPTSITYRTTRERGERSYTNCLRMAVPRELLAGTYHQPHTERCETTDKEGRRRDEKERGSRRERGGGEREEEEVEDRRVEQRER